MSSIKSEVVVAEAAMVATEGKEMDTLAKIADMRSKEIKNLEAQKTLLEEKLKFLQSEEGIKYLSWASLGSRGGSGGGGGVSGSTATKEKNKQTKLKKNDPKERLKQLFEKCREILVKLKKHSNAQPFLTPVDPVKLKCPDYYDFIKNPMDLSTVTRKLKSGKIVYDSPLEFRDDIRQIFVNCCLYNPEGHVVRNYGLTLGGYFETLWKDSNIEESYAIIRQAMVPLKNNIGTSDKTQLEKSNQMGMGQSSMNQVNLLLLFRSLEKELWTYVEHSKDAKDLDMDQQLFIRKRILSRNLENLSQDNMELAMKIIEDNLVLEDSSSSELITVDNLDVNIIAYLENFIKMVGDEFITEAKRDIIESETNKKQCDIKIEEEEISYNLDDIPYVVAGERHTKRKMSSSEDAHQASKTEFSFQSKKSEKTMDVDEDEEGLPLKKIKPDTDDTTMYE